MKKLFKEEFKNAWDRINSGIPFCHARYADGEICLMKGLSINKGSQATDVDNWTSPAKITKLGKELKETLKCTDENYYYAISCDSSSTDDKNYLLSNIKQDKKYITFANLWINGNYNDFIKNINNNLQNKNIILFANYRGENNKFPFQIKNYMSFGDECVLTWEKYSSDIKSMLYDNFKNIENHIFLISVGPMSEVLIYTLWSFNKKNQYIDVGSALDYYIHGKNTRLYMMSNNFYNKQICEMDI